MNKSKTLTIQISPEDYTRLETEAERLNLSPDTLAGVMLRDRLARVKPQIEPREALLCLRAIGRKLPPIDAVKLACESREELEQGGIF